MKLRSIYAAFCLLTAVSLFVTACGNGNPVQTSSGTTSGSAPAQTTSSPAATTKDTKPATLPAVGSKTITIQCGSKSETGEGSVELSVSSRNFKEGEKIIVTLPEGQHYLAFNLSKSSMKEAILYVPGNQFTYTIPKVNYSYPSAITKGVVTARIPDESELTAVHNLALNPADLIDPSMKITGFTYNAYWAADAYPHATTSSACRFATNEDSKYQFEARNAIDGFTQNNGHGNYPVQSWGPDEDFNTRTGFITIDFGHDVKVDTLNLYIRADFPHDTYFTSAEIVFSDGSKETIKLTNSAKVQAFELGGKTTSSIKLTKMSKADASGWAGLMEIEVMGSEILG